jgi:hypothetical protein
VKEKGRIESDSAIIKGRWLQYVLAKLEAYLLSRESTFLTIESAPSACSRTGAWRSVRVRLGIDPYTPSAHQVYIFSFKMLERPLYLYF